MLVKINKLTRAIMQSTIIVKSAIWKEYKKKLCSSQILDQKKENKKIKILKHTPSQQSTERASFGETLTTGHAFLSRSSTLSIYGT